jgi:hypothetical protein
MKMSSLLVERTLSQFEAQPLADDHPRVAQLNQLFGEHTFFLDGSGLHIVEPAEPTDAGAEKGVVVKLASRSDLSHTSLAPHPPEVTDLIVMLEAA